jgi:hypothetical protein
VTDVTQPTIDEALDAFVAEQHERLAPSTYGRYGQVVGLLRCCLDEYGYSALADTDQVRWRDAVEAGDEQAFCRLFGADQIATQITGFLDWFMIRKVIAGAGLLKASGTVCGALVRWLGAHGHVDEATARELSAHARQASRELPDCERLASLLHDACDFEVDVDEVSDDDWVEDHLQITDVAPGQIWFDGDVGPIRVSRRASELARPGWEAMICAARLKDGWRLVEVGSVYP